MKYHRSVLIIWAVSVIVFASMATQFLSIATLSFEPPPGSKSAIANDLFASHFPGHDADCKYTALVQVPPGLNQSVKSLAGIANFSKAVQKSINDTGLLTSFTSFVTLEEEGLSSAQLISPDGRATLLSWSINDLHPEGKNARAFGKRGAEVLDNKAAEFLPAGVLLGSASMSQMTDLAVEAAEYDMGRMDGIALPIAVIVLWFIVKSGRLMIIPLINMGASAALSFGLMYLIGLVSVVEMSTSSLMMSILIAMSVDYSLFLLTRFREELLYESEAGNLNGNPDKVIARVVVKMMETAGCTILLSGSTLTSSFLVVAFFPVELISSMGVGCALALALTLLANLTLTPAVIVAFPGFFIECVSNDRFGARVYKYWLGCCRKQASAAEEPMTNITAAEHENSQPQGAPPNERRFWWALARCTTRLPFSALLLALVLAVAAAVGSRTLDLQITASLELSVPRGTTAMETYKSMDREFGQGLTVPYRVLIAPPAGSTVVEDHFWSVTAAALAEIQQELKQYGESNMQFMNYVTGYPPVPFAVIQQCQAGTAPKQIPCHALLTGIAQFSGESFPKSSAMYGFVTTKFDPAGVNGKKFFEKLLHLLDEQQTKTGYTWAVAGDMASCFDLITTVYGAFPKMVIGTMVVAFLFLAISFRSIIIPLRSLLTIAATVAFVYGAAVLVFQDGILDWMHFDALDSKYYNKAIPYLMPVISFPIVVGICLDYDIFLLTRASEFRADSGLQARDAIQHGLVATGWIITAAGVIMAIAFGGLLFSSMAQLNVLSFFMVVAVLFDTFVVRVLLAPPAMALLDRFLWWPNSLSYKVQHLAGEDSQNPDLISLQVDPTTGP